MTAERVIALRPLGRGRQPRVVEELRDQRDELAAHCDEAIAFLDYVEPRLYAILPALRELGPREYQLGESIARRLGQYRRRHTPEPDPAVAAAA